MGAWAGRGDMVECDVNSLRLTSAPSVTSAVWRCHSPPSTAMGWGIALHRPGQEAACSSSSPLVPDAAVTQVTGVSSSQSLSSAQRKGTLRSC